MKKITIIALTTAILFAVSCKKKEDPAPTPSKTEMLTSGSWKITAFTIGGADQWSSEDACTKDDIFIFKADKSYSNEEGATKCSGADPQVISTGTWAFTANETKLIYDGDTATINELTSTKMVLQTDLLGTPAIATFSH